MDNSPLVFVSHSSKDVLAVKKVISLLRTYGIRYWVSFENLGEESQYSKISAQIDECDVFLFIWSANSLNSHQVDVEIHKAHAINKPFAIYQLDAAKPPLGLDMLVGYKQFRVLPAGTDQARLGKLAKLIFLASGMPEEKTDLVICISQQRLKLEEQRKVEKWADRLWSYKYDANRKRVRELSRYDESRLSQLAKQLGIAKEVQAEYKTRYKRDMRGFIGIVRSAFRESSELTESDVVMLDEKRKLCCIPLAEAKEIVLRYSKQSILPANKSELRKSYEWIFGDTSSDTVEAKTPRSFNGNLKNQNDSPIDRLEQASKSNISFIDPVGDSLEDDESIQTSEVGSGEATLAQILQAVIGTVLLLIFLLASAKIALEIIAWLIQGIFAMVAWVLTNILKRGIGLA